MAKKSNKSDTLKGLMIIALEKSLGVVTTACKSVKIARSTHYEWMQTDEQYKNEVLSIQDVAIDFAESQLHKQINDGNTSATIFYLKTKGKKRGYVERSEIKIDNDKPDFSGYTTEELIELAKQDEKKE
jgi:hypothetical protein